MEIDIETLELKELKTLRSQIDKAIAGYDDRRRAVALQALEGTARDHGFSLEQLTGVTVAKTRKPAQVKYVNPENSNETWSGRGRKPRWVVAALADGKTLEDLAI